MVLPAGGKATHWARVSPQVETTLEALKCGMVVFACLNFRPLNISAPNYLEILSLHAQNSARVNNKYRDSDMQGVLWNFPFKYPIGDITEKKKPKNKNPKNFQLFMFMIFMFISFLFFH